MEDGEKRVNVEVNISRQPLTNMFNDGSIFKSIWIRCNSIFSNIMDRKFMESKLRFVLFCGTIFWIIYLFQKII
jgi:hypothetical protein